MEAIDKGDVIGSLFIDFRKAFDMVDHSLLIRKLEHYKVNSTSLDWFKSYLSSRAQTIKSDSGLSDLSHVISGVPQGSILGQTLFLLFINDLPLYLNHCLADLYADDSTFHVSAKNKTEIEMKLQSDGDVTDKWSRRNNLPIHYGKSTCMTLGTRQKIDKIGKLNLQIDNAQIEHVSSQKLLGIVIDETLSWNPHIDHLCTVISSKISLLKQLSTYVQLTYKKCSIKVTFYL